MMNFLLTTGRKEDVGRSSHTDTTKETQSEAVHAMMPGNFIASVPHWLNNGSVKQLSHSTCHSQMITHDMCFVTQKPNWT